MRIDVKPEELPILEVFLVLLMQVGAQVVKPTIIKISTPLHLIHDRMVHQLELVQAEHALREFLVLMEPGARQRERGFARLLKQLWGGVVGEGVLVVGVAPLVHVVMHKACTAIVLLLQCAGLGFECC